MGKKSKPRKSNKIRRKSPRSAALTPAACLRWLSRCFFCCYLLVVILILPFYSPQGNIMLATHKQSLFLVGAAFLIPAVLLGVPGLGRCRIFPLSATDHFALLYMTSLSLSYFCSPYRSVALLGEAGWKMGFLPQLAFLASYFLMSRIWMPDGKWPALLLAVSTAASLFTTLDRFGVRLFPIEPYNAQYLFTLGNINWYCGYLVTLLFAAVFFYLSAPLPQKERPRRLASRGLLCCLGLGFLSLAVQGSSSGVLTLAVLLPVLFGLCVSSSERMLRFWNVLLTLGAALSLGAVIRLLFPDAITYLDGGTSLLTSPGVALTALLFGLCGTLLFRYAVRRGRYPLQGLRRVRILLLAAGAAGIIGYVLLLVVNTVRPGRIGALSGLSAFTFSPDWGSKRGATWIAGVHCFLQSSPLQKLIGVGPDCMYSALLECPHGELTGMLSEQFGIPLTNAHNELLTTLVNEGLLGAVSFAGMLAAGMIRDLRLALTHRTKASAAFLPALAGACGLGVLAYAVHNTVSFAQILNAPVLYLLLGMGEGCHRFSSSPDNPCSS